MSYVFVGDLWIVFEVRLPPDNYVSHALCSRIFVIRLFIVRVSFCLGALLALISYFLFVFLHLLLLSCIADAEPTFPLFHCRIYSGYNNCI
jgi:hypothetical protein